MYQGTPVASDSATKSLLYDWFQLREVNSCDEDKFLLFYKRNLKQFYPRYLLLLEDELIELPEFANYKSDVTGQVRNYGKIVNEIIHDLTNTKDRTDNLQDETDLTTKYTGTKTIDHDGTVNMHGRDDNQLVQNSSNQSSTSEGHDAFSDSWGDSGVTNDILARGMMRNLPQSIEYDGNDFVAVDPTLPQNQTGLPIQMDWRTATSQAEDSTINLTNEAHNEHNVSGGSGTSGTSASGNVKNTGFTTFSHDQTNDLTDLETRDLEDSREGTLKHTGTQNVTDKYTGSTSNERRLDDKHDIYTTEVGLKNMTEPEIRQKVWDYITNSIAAQWFIGKMERCFIGVFD